MTAWWKRNQFLIVFRKISMIGNLNMNHNRQDIVEYLNRQLVGPSTENELINDKPHKRYLMGILFPIEAVEDEVDEETPEELDNSVSLASEFKPSSMALSFSVSAGAKVKISLSSGVYSCGQDKQWRREGLKEVIVFNCSEESPKPKKIFDKRGKVTIIKRPWKNGYIVTVALTNDKSSGARLDPSDCLYQAKIHCQSDGGCFKEYPGSERFKFDNEQQELALLYSKRINWSVGHGCASIWDDEGDEPTWISSSSIPEKEVFGFSTTIDFDEYPDVPKNILNLQDIAALNSDKDLVVGLKLFVAAYKAWITSVEMTQVAEQHGEARGRIIERLHVTAKRMVDGINSLGRSKNAMKSFRLANQAMLIQMVHSDNKYGGESRAKNEKSFVQPDYFSSTYEKYEWRPFQLAFQLLVIESLVHDEAGDFAESRDVVDLLWFPTGGGKTEAYLAVAAWEIFYRRLEDGLKGAGTAVIKRYTLRLLTSQQFQRAGTLICAMENMRRELHIEMGDQPFTLGLWVGQDSAPNKFTSGDRDKPAALEKYLNLRDEDKPENPFQLQRCPWCGTSIVPKEITNDKSDYGIRASETKFSFYCPTDSCSFNHHLPIQVVDEGLYQSPPSMLIGTVDKFARLAWMDKTKAFFGEGKFNPPSLIIQDELHLISGPLGTVAGIYEAGIDALIWQLGGRAKVIAATATIRAAEQQSRRLFGREVKIFPPTGIDESDSFFSKEDKSAPGRLYLGIMPTGHTGQTSLVQTAAAMLQAPVETKQTDAELDTWWTLPIYHNSRRELGKTMTLARDDIPSRIAVIAEKTGNKRECNIVEELSANVKGARIPEILDKLDIDAANHGVIDVLPCTNMISVGVDISRLGIMLVNGQPKTTAEYIQASSRVGRDKKRPPAVVVTLYSPSKPRDRSHYETFSSYHQALYRHVEPTSITPWAKPARERALHAALITLVRLSGYLPGNDMASSFDKDNKQFLALYSGFKQRIRESASDLDDAEVEKILSHLDALVSEWHYSAKDGNVNRYDSSKQFKPLMKTFGQTKKAGVWPTLNSMRNVDTETTIFVKGEDQ
ncbi:helicase-related protein [Marinomonas sp. PE14-40]|uniref:helicase-related protein n=1 Tax=Marinomonas sp. PE14-40 TaxID=3060621 RepID=UPI003F6709F0